MSKIYLLLLAVAIAVPSQIDYVIAQESEQSEQTSESSVDNSAQALDKVADPTKDLQTGEVRVIYPETETDPVYALSQTSAYDKRTAKPPVQEDEESDIETPIGQVSGILGELNGLKRQQTEINDSLRGVAGIMDAIAGLKETFSNGVTIHNEELLNAIEDLRGTIEDLKASQEATQTQLDSLEAQIKESSDDVKSTVDFLNDFIQNKLASSVAEGVAKSATENNMPPYWKLVVCCVIAILIIVVLSLFTEACKGICGIFSAMKKYRDAQIKAEAAKLYARESQMNTASMRGTYGETSQVQTTTSGTTTKQNNNLQLE